MSVKNSDSESNGWAVVSNEDTESSDDGDSSSGSADFVKVETPESVSYHHHTHADVGQASASEGCVLKLDETNGTQASGCQSLQTELKLVLQLKDHGMTIEEEEAETDELVAVENESRDNSVSSGNTYTLHSNSCSSFEELELHEGQEQGEEMQRPTASSSLEMIDTADAQQHSDTTQSHLPRLSEDRERKISHESDSDHSDFVRLDPSMPEECAGDLMRLSSISSESTGSSLSSSFRFIHRSGMILGADEYMRRQFYRDNDDESVQSDIDDRCESDISGVADDDMSSYSLGDLPISAGNVVRSYKHRPNNNLNTSLTTLALVVLFGAVGIGVGHFMGTCYSAGLRRQQVVKMQSVTDDYLMCLQHQEILEDKLDNGEELRLAAVANEWKEQYEELVSERVDLEQQIDMLKQTVVDQQEKENAIRLVMLRQVNELAHMAEALEYEHNSQLEFQTQAETAITDLKNEVSTLRIENDDLTFSVAKMRYKTLKEAQREQEAVLRAELYDPANELPDENAHVKQDVATRIEHPGNGRSELVDQPDPALINCVTPSTDIVSDSNSNSETDEIGERMSDGLSVQPGVPASSTQATFEEVEDLKQKLAETNEKLYVAKGKADLWQSLFQVESERVAKAERNSPDVMSCLYTMFPDLTLADFSQMSQNTVSNMSQFISKQWRFIKNMTRDETFSNVLKRKWSHLQDLFDSPAVSGASQKAKAVYDDIHNTIENKFEEFIRYSREFTKQADPTKEGPEKVKTQKKSQFDKAFNKTKETVQKLTEKINETWNEVKDIPGQLAETLVPGVTKKMEEFADKINSGWDKVNKKVNAGWKNVINKVNDGWFHNDHNKRDNHHHGENDHRRRHHYKFEATVDARKQYHGDPYLNSDTGDMFDDIYKFENKPDHKQKQSKIDTEKRYADFWDAVGFDPDDMFHEGFLEGNDRKWRKHQKTLRKLYGRIQMLNEHILHDMDDDDIEDIYDDLEDFEDDLDFEVHPITLKTWLSCQIRWWKSRFQRKHRDEDLIQGCGRKLMHWQMKSSCSTKCKAMKRCKVHVHESPICQHFLSHSVIKTVANPSNSKANHENNRKDGVKSKNNNQRAQKSVETPMSHFDPDELIPAYNIENFTMAVDEGVHEEMISDSRVQNEKSREGPRGDALDKEKPYWLFERARDLEYRMHKTDWMYRRAHDRDFHRKRPSDWYHERVQAREHRHYLKRKP